MIHLSGTWRFRPEGRDETTIEVPDFWEAQGFLELDGRAVYERDVVLDRDVPFATLEFDAVADLCEVFVNGERVGSHEVGFTPFRLDVSDALRRGANVVRVEVVDPVRGDPDFLVTPQGKQGWGNIPFPSPPSVYMTYGGIWQPCRLVLHDGAYVSDVWCDMDPDAPTVGVTVDGECDEVEVRAFGSVERGPAGAFRFGSAEPWSPSSPKLHEISVTAFVGDRTSHTRTIRTGLRRIERSGDDVLLNGAPYRMRSALHQGFWPDGLYRADAKLVRRDVELALEAGLNTLRTHLKAFEPEWLDAADELGLLVHADMPFAEPLREASLLEDETFLRRCLIGLREQVRRDRSRPSIVVWTIFNEVGLMEPSMLKSKVYKSVVAELHDALRELDPSRPVVENDWVFKRPQLVRSDVRTAHWYGRTTKEFLDEVETWLAEVPKESGPFYVSEFGEWGLPSPEPEQAFWGQDDELASLIREAGWTGDVEELIAGSQRAQGWSDRIQAERFRISPAVQGFCLTEWTDVPHELNGLVSLRRNVKASVDEFRRALVDVCPIAVLDRYSFVRGEPVEMRVFLSNWSSRKLSGDNMGITIGDASTELAVDQVAAGGVVFAGRAKLPADGDTLTLTYGDAVSSYAIHVCEPVGDVELPEWLLLEPESLPEGWSELEDVPTRWGPTPIIFPTQEFASLGSSAVLSHELYACYPKKVIGGMHGPLNLVCAPPIAKWGAVIAERDGLVVCTLPIDAETGFGRALVADLVRMRA